MQLLYSVKHCYKVIKTFIQQSFKGTQKNNKETKYPVIFHRK